MSNENDKINGPKKMKYTYTQTNRLIPYDAPEYNPEDPINNLPDSDIKKITKKNLKEMIREELHRSLLKEEKKTGKFKTKVKDFDYTDKNDILKFSKELFTEIGLDSISKDMTRVTSKAIELKNEAIDLYMDLSAYQEIGYSIDEITNEETEEIGSVDIEYTYYLQIEGSFLIDSSVKVVDDDTIVEARIDLKTGEVTYKTDF